jgi:uncharacterized membrane protein YhaH (DUF805 family)
LKKFSVFADYWKVTVLNVFVFLILLTGRFFFGISAAYFLFLFLVLLLSRISFNKKGFAFRTHDVLLSMGF